MFKRSNSRKFKINYLDLFHGIGGFALAAHWAGLRFNKHYCSDIEPFAQELYARRFPDSIQLGDITKINIKELKNEKSDWIISGGFPCQDISGLGRRRGLAGSRSGLWLNFAKIICMLQPKFVMVENVPVLTGRGLDVVLASLASCGYNAEWQVIHAGAFGAPHRRERIWIVAYPDSFRWDNRSPAQIKEHTKRNNKNPKEWKQLQEITYRDNKIHNWENCKSIIHRDNDGIPEKVDRDRITALGNAIVPQNAQFIFSKIKELLDEEQKT